MNHINLKIPEHSYFFGFAQTDGNLDKLSRNRGHLAIEIKEKDRNILESFQKLFPLVHSSIRIRIRDTNFKKNHKSCTLTICDKRFRDEINKLGIPYGKKSEIVVPPLVEFCEKDYIRGITDGDGSIGMRLGEYPFVSLTVKSERIKDYFIGAIEKITGEKKKLKRNKRDDIYNIMLNREKAQQFIRYLYYPGCLALKRKLKKAREVLKWKRPRFLKIIFRNEWHKWEDKYLLGHTTEESKDFLKRTRRSIKMRLWHLKQATLLNRL